MINDQEVPRSSQSIEGQISEQDKANLYTYVDFLHHQGASLLGQYLPQALPQEPTTMFVGFISNYVGKFKGRHYIALERPSALDPMVQFLEKQKQASEAEYENIKRFGELEHKRIDLLIAKAAEGEVTMADLEEIERKIKIEEEAMKQMPIEETKKEPQDWQEPTKMLQGPSQYSEDTWKRLSSSLHEQIHQTQAELNPSAFPVLESPELDEIDPNFSDRSHLYKILMEAHKSYNRAQNNDSLFYPVIEGMAVLGTFYVMGRFAEDLAKAGETEAAQRLQKVRMWLIHDEVVVPRREMRLGKDDYNFYYTEGYGIMRKLFKHFGLENIPQIVSNIDLAACRQIAKDSPMYQQIIDNPSFLPGLPQLV